MYPGMMHWWRMRRAADWGSYAACHPMSEPGHHARAWSGRFAAPPDADFGAGAFGVRRPLRFLAYKLRLSDAQVAEFARILDELKTERAQAEVDGRRALAAFADAVGGATYDAARAAEGAGLRVRSAERLRDAVLKALEQMHAVLEAEQRARLAYLIRTGTVLL